MTENEQPHLQNDKEKGQMIVMIISAGNSRRLATVSHVWTHSSSGRVYSSWGYRKRLALSWNRNYMGVFVHPARQERRLWWRTKYLRTHEPRTAQSTQRHFDHPSAVISHRGFFKRVGVTSAIKVRLSNNWSRVHFVRRQNSLPTSAIWPVRRHTTVGVPL